MNLGLIFITGTKALMLQADVMAAGDTSRIMVCITSHSNELCSCLPRMTSINS